MPSWGWILLSPERWGAFAEYVIRPMTEDIRIILEKLKELSPPLSEPLVRQVGLGLLLAHLAGEFLRAVTYIAITFLVCQTALRIL